MSSARLITGSKNYKEAPRNFERSVDKDDKYFRGYYNLARSEFYAGNKGEAKKAYEKLKKLIIPSLAEPAQRRQPRAGYFSYNAPATCVSGTTISYQ